MKALTAKDTAGRVIGGVGGALGFGAMIPGPQQPFLLAAAAITQIVGPMIAKMFSPKGPRFDVGGLGGLGVRVVLGAWRSQGTSRPAWASAERLPGGADPSAIQEALEARVAGWCRAWCKP